MPAENTEPLLKIDDVVDTYLVTRANRGIGLEYCRQLKEQEYQVIAVCRTPSPELSALGTEILAGIDLTSEENVTSLVN